MRNSIWPKASVTWLLAATLACKSRAPDTSATLSAPRNATNPGEPGAEGRANPSHFAGPFTVDGAFDLDPGEIAKKYKGLKVERFGTVAVSFGQAVPANGNGIMVRDMHYHLGNGRAGIRPIPVMDKSPSGNIGKTANGVEVRGSELMDAYLRKRMSLGPTDPIFAVTTYMHPEEYAMDLTKLAAQSLKLQNGQTHMGAYLGDGTTRNAPHEYNDQTWQVGGYPANVSIIGLRGVEQKVLNQNMVIVLRLLNEGNTLVKMPFDWTFDPLPTVTLADQLEFFRAWLDPAYTRPGESTPLQEKLLSDPAYYTYCAEHVMLAVNVALNVPQNEAGYVGTWGPVEGKALWARAQKMYGRITKRFDGGAQPIPDVPGFEPLWRSVGIADPAKGSEFGKGMAWPAETTADIVASFAEQYAAWPDVGVVASAATMFGFAKEFTRRTGLEPKTYVRHLLPFLIKAVEAEATTKPFGSASDPEASFSDYVAQVKTGLTRVVAGARQESPELGDKDVNLDDSLVGKAVSILSARKSALLAKPPQTVEKAWDAYRATVASDLAKARLLPLGKDANGSSEAFVRYYVSPAVIHRITSGMFPSEPRVSILTVATAFHPSELVGTQEAARQYDTKTGQRKILPTN